MFVVVNVLTFLQNFNVVLICAELLFCRYFPRRRKFPLRLLLVAVFAFLFCKEAAPIMPWAVFTSFTQIPFFIVGGFFNISFVIMFAISCAIMAFCFDAPPWKIMSLCAMGYVLQNSQYQITEMFRYSAFSDNIMLIGYRMAAMGVIAACFVAAYFVPVRYYCTRKTDDMLFACGYTFISLMLVIGVSYMIFVLDRYNIVYHIYALVSCVLLFFIRLGEFAKLRSDGEREKLKEMLEKRDVQREFFWVNAEELNRKCHDLKHAINGLRRMGGGAEGEKYIADMEHAVAMYDTRIKTECETADIVLTEKSMQCAANGIKLSCMVDGGALASMDALDLYVFLGNAMDNAIEAELHEERENRSISVNVRARGNLTLISVENYFGGQLRMRNDLPETTKSSREGHGYGVGSMRRTAEKYGGALAVRTENGRFILSAVIPAKR